MSRSPQPERITQMSQSPRANGSNQGGERIKIESERITQMNDLTVLLTVLLTNYRARGRVSTETPATASGARNLSAKAGVGTAAGTATQSRPIALPRAPPAPLRSGPASNATSTANYSAPTGCRSHRSCSTTTRDRRRKRHELPHSHRGQERLRRRRRDPVMPDMQGTAKGLVHQPDHRGDPTHSVHPPAPPSRTSPDRLQPTHRPRGVGSARFHRTATPSPEDRTMTILAARQLTQRQHDPIQARATMGRGGSDRYTRGDCPAPRWAFVHALKFRRFFLPHPKGISE